MSTGKGDVISRVSIRYSQECVIKFDSITEFPSRCGSLSAF